MEISCSAFTVTSLSHDLPWNLWTVENSEVADIYRTLSSGIPISLPVVHPAFKLLFYVLLTWLPPNKWIHSLYK